MVKNMTSTRSLKGEKMAKEVKAKKKPVVIEKPKAKRVRTAVVKKKPIVQECCRAQYVMIWRRDTLWQRFKDFLGRFNILSLILNRNRNMKSNLFVSGIFMLLIIAVCCVCIFTACTYTIQNTISSGSSDVVDSEPKTDAVVSPQLSVPLSAM